MAISYTIQNHVTKFLYHVTKLSQYVFDLFVLPIEGTKVVLRI